MNPHSGDFRGWYTSGKLPHFDAPGTIQFITFRLADSLPSHILREMRKEVDRLPEGLRSDALRVQMEKYLDQGYGSCVLFHPEMRSEERRGGNVLWLCRVPQVQRVYSCESTVL